MTGSSTVKSYSSVFSSTRVNRSVTVTCSDTWLPVPPVELVREHALLHVVLQGMEVRGLDDQRIPFPVPPGVAVPRTDVVGQPRSVAQADDAGAAELLDHDGDVVGVLHDVVVVVVAGVEHRRSRPRTERHEAALGQRQQLGMVELSERLPVRGLLGAAPLAFLGQLRQPPVLRTRDERRARLAVHDDDAVARVHVEAVVAAGIGRRLGRGTVGIERLEAGRETAQGALLQLDRFLQGQRRPLALGPHEGRQERVAPAALDVRVPVFRARHGPLLPVRVLRRRGGRQRREPDRARQRENEDTVRRLHRSTSCL